LSPVKWDQLLGEALLYWSSSLSPVKWDQLLVTALEMFAEIAEKKKDYRNKQRLVPFRGMLVQQLEASKMGPAAGGSFTLLVQQLEPSEMGPAAGYCLGV
jgi:hypothetical protein